jgi:salicylate hydroxylase
MPKAIEVLGEDMANTRTMYLGQNGHIITFPVAHGQIMNVVAFHHDFQNWEDEQLVVPTTRTEAQRDFADWGHNAKAIIELLQDTLDKWGIFDLGDEPMSFYSKGRVCVAGDAAHATGPHHGAGAGFCIEDSAVLAELLHVAWASLQGGLTTIPKNDVLGHVLSVYDNARRERTQWLVRSSRISADLYDWMDQDCGRDPLKIKKELLWRNQRIWNVSIDDMTQDANKTLEAAICDARDLRSIVHDETTATH